MAWYPAFLDLEGKRVVIVGGGRTALAKARHLKAYGCELMVIAPDIVPDMPGTTIQRPVRQTDIQGADLVICAALPAVNRQAADWCSQARILCNVVDDKAASSFIAGANLTDGDLSIGVCTGGASPRYAALLRDAIREIVPEDAADVLRQLLQERQEILETVPDEQERARLLVRLAEEAWHAKG